MPGGGEDQSLVYPSVRVSREIEIRRLHSVYYFRFSAGYPLPGEKHNFWEFVYMDSGEAEITAGGQTVILRQGEILFHQPNEYHRIWTNRMSSPNVVVVSFSSSSPAMAVFRGARFSVTSEQKRCLGHIIAEAQHLYGPLLDCHRDLTRDIRKDAPIGTLQLLAGYVEMLLVLLARQKAETDKPLAARAGPTTDEMRAAEITGQLQAYMREHLADALSFDDFCRHVGMGSTALKSLFQRYNGIGVMRCYQQMRIDEARRLLRSGRLNVSEVAALLGYASSQYFSAQFKRLMGVSPTQYLHRVR